MPAARTRTSTSSGPGTGVGTSCSTSGCPVRISRIARMRRLSVEIAFDLAEQVHAVHEVGEPVEVVGLEPQHGREVVAPEPVLVQPVEPAQVSDRNVLLHRATAQADAL